MNIARPTPLETDASIYHDHLKAEYGKDVKILYTGHHDLSILEIKDEFGGFV